MTNKPEWIWVFLCFFLLYPYVIPFSTIIRKSLLIRYLYHVPFLSNSYLLSAAFAMAFSSFFPRSHFLILYFCHGPSLFFQKSLLIQYLCHDLFLFYPEVTPYPILMPWLFPLFSQRSLLIRIICFSIVRPYTSPYERISSFPFLQKDL